MGKNQRLKVHRQWLPGRSLCSIRSNRKWCKRRGSSLECQNCFFVYPIIDSNLKNLLDNAIEANCKLDMTKRRLQIEIKPYNNMLLLFISNSSNGIYLYGGNGNLLTTKTSNKNEHGIGIKRINEIVKKYNGIIEFDPGTEIFSVSILFPLDN